MDSTPAFTAAQVASVSHSREDRSPANSAPIDGVGSWAVSAGTARTTATASTRARRARAQKGPAPADQLAAERAVRDPEDVREHAAAQHDPQGPGTGCRTGDPGRDDR